MTHSLQITNRATFNFRYIFCLAGLLQNMCQIYVSLQGISSVKFMVIINIHLLLACWITSNNVQREKCKHQYYSMFKAYNLLSTCLVLNKHGCLKDLIIQRKWKINFALNHLCTAERMFRTHMQHK